MRLWALIDLVVGMDWQRRAERRWVGLERRSLVLCQPTSDDKSEAFLL